MSADATGNPPRDDGSASTSMTGNGGTGTGAEELALASRVAELVRRAAGPTAEAEVLVSRTDLALTRFANSFIHQNVAESNLGVRLRLHVDGRTASGGGSLVDPAGLTALVDRTLAAARLCPPDPAWSGLTPPTALPQTAGWDAATADAAPAERAERVRAFVEAAGGLESAGYCRTSQRVAAYVNTAGQHGTGRMSEAAMDGIARATGSDGVARLAADRLADLDGAILGARAAAKARAGVDKVELPPGRYEVVLEPAAVVDLLKNLAMYGFNGKRYAERQSFVELGAAQFDPAVTLVDDPLAGSSWPFDIEGTPRRRLTLVEAGTTRAVPHDRRSAASVGASSTGHAMPGGATFGPLPRSLHLAPAGDHPANRAGADSAGRAGGGAAGRAGGGAATGAVAVAGVAALLDADTAALVAGVRRGLLVSDLWYTRVLDPRSLVVTGLTRNGVWLIEDGVLTSPVRDFRFTQSYPSALAPRAVLGLGRSAVRQPDSWDATCWAAPPLHLASWNFTGNASG